MTYQFEYDDLTEDSKLYKALAAKFGEPSYKNPPNQMRWKGGAIEVNVECSYQNCKMIVEDSLFERTENRRQEEADAAARRSDAPDPNL